MRSILKPSTLQLGSSGNGTDSNTSNAASVLKPGLLRPPVIKIDNADSDETQPNASVAEQSTPSPNPFLLNNVNDDDDDPPNDKDVAGDSGIGEGIEPQDGKSTDEKSEVSLITAERIESTLKF